MSGEIASRGGLPAVPTMESFGTLLGRYMWVNAVSLDWGWPGTVRIEGNLKPDFSAKTPSAVRRSLLDSLDAVMAILDAAGAQWESHPDLQISGRVMHLSDGKQEFAAIEGRVDFRLVVLA